MEHDILKSFRQIITCSHEMADALSKISALLHEVNGALRRQKDEMERIVKLASPGYYKSKE
jgi:hypothetical protein